MFDPGAGVFPIQPIPCTGCDVKLCFSVFLPSKTMGRTDNVSKKITKTSSGDSENRTFPEGQRIFTQRQIIKNLVVISTGFVLFFTAYNGLSMLQSTMNQQQGIGVVSQAIIYAAFCISALILPKYTIKKLGCKRALLLSMTVYVPYVAANFYFNWITMVPSAILVGLGASVLWSSQCTYFNESACIYSRLILKKNHDTLDIPNGKCNLNRKGKVEFSLADGGRIESLGALDAKMLQNDANVMLSNNMATLNNCYLNKSFQDSVKNNEISDFEVCTLTEANLNNSETFIGNKKAIEKSFSYSEEYSRQVSSVTARFFGFFGLVFKTSDVWSNLISYYILHDNNILDNVTGSGNCSCGASFCNVESNCFEHNLAEPSQQMRNILTGVCVMLSVVGILLVLLFLDELETDKQPVTFSFNFAMATCKFVRKKEALLLIPLSAYIGLQQGFYIGDFTKSYIACAWGVYHVGLVTMCYGLAAGTSSTLAGFMVKYVGRISVMLFGAVTNAAINIFLLFWNPLPDQPLQFFVSAAMWGIAVGILWSQLRAFYGVIFKKDEEAAFAGFYLWDSIGYCVAFSYSNYICTYLKIYILLAVSTLGIIGFLKTEMIHIQQSKDSNQTIKL